MMLLGIEDSGPNEPPDRPNSSSLVPVLGFIRNIYRKHSQLNMMYLKPNHCLRDVYEYLVHDYLGVSILDIFVH